MATKYSKKREALLDCLRQSHEHPTAEMLYQTLKPAIPELSLGTVYRNLGLLVQEGKAVRVGSFAGQERFDGRLDPHAHFVCRRCRRVLDLDLPDTVSCLLTNLDEASGFQAEGYALTVTGLCPGCREQEGLPYYSGRDAAADSTARRLS